MKEFIFVCGMLFSVACFAQYVTTCQTMPNGQVICTTKKASMF